MKKIQKGFTLIELLIVIAILGILAAATMVGIDPIDKINLANDSKVQKDVGFIANAMESYAVQNAGVYAATQAVLVTSGDLKVALNPPTGYAYNVSGGASGKVDSTLKAKKYATMTFYVWCSASGRAAAMATNACP